MRWWCPREQTCCGQMHMNSGYRREAMPLAERFVATYGEFEAVVSPSSSCVGAIRVLYGQLLGIDHPVLERTMELSELLVHRLGVEDVGAHLPAPGDLPPDLPFAAGDADRRRAAAAAAQRQGAGAARAAGSHASAAASVARSPIKNADTSSAILADKCRAIESTGAEVCTALDGSCLLQIGGGSRVAATGSRRSTWRRSSRRAEVSARTSSSTPVSRGRRRSALARYASCAANLGNATGAIRDKRAHIVAELPDWEALRDAGRAIKADVMASLDTLPGAVRAGGHGRRRTSTGPATARRRTRWSPRSRARTARRRS